MDTQRNRFATEAVSPPITESRTTIRVTYRDTDQMGFVYYANYFVYFESGRTELLRRLGRNYRDLERDGIFLPVLEATCKYTASARYDDLLEVTTRVARWTRAAIDFEYECRRAEGGALLVTGTTRHAFTNRDGKIVRVGHTILPAKAPPDEQPHGGREA